MIKNSALIVMVVLTAHTLIYAHFNRICQEGDTAEAALAKQSWSVLEKKATDTVGQKSKIRIDSLLNSETFGRADYQKVLNNR